MKKAGNLLAALIVSTTLITRAIASTDGVYTLSEATYTWDGTDADRLKATSAGYDYDYGDETSLSHTLPWPFIYYGQTYNQITVDTNGNIWFGYAGSAYSFNLSNAGKGPVIANWNNDLSSLYYGGFFIQHKTNPERVVIEWQSETFSDQGTSSLNNFEVVLFPDGSFRSDYKTFNAIKNNDFGSGISKDDGTHFLSLTANYGPAYTLVGRSLAFTPTPPVINVIFSGTGKGTVTSTPVGIACNTNCSSSFPLGTPLNLHPAASQYSLFTGWTNGICSGTADCLMTMSADSSVTSVFDYDVTHQVSIGNTTPVYYSTIQGAYNVAANGDIIKLWATTYTESLTCNRPIAAILQGGYDSSYGGVTGVTVIKGPITLTDGNLILDGNSKIESH